MRITPVVLLAYNRPENARKLIESLREHKPQHIIFSVDGPKASKSGDVASVAAVQNLASLIDWTPRVELKFRAVNIGLRAAVSETVSEVVDSYGEAIIMEDDTQCGKDWLHYASYMLDRYRKEPKVEHISGYNLAPVERLSTPVLGSRLSRYPESFAWATWNRAWQHYDDSVKWGLDASIEELSAITGSVWGALRWKQNFMDAHSGRISSWAYRWISSMWSRNSFMVSPNQNLVTYTGFESGTHTVMKAPWIELPLYQGKLQDLLSDELVLDQTADEWIGNQIFAETPYGVGRGVLISAALATRKKYRELKNR